MPVLIDTEISHFNGQTKMGAETVLYNFGTYYKVKHETEES
jgi:hypothetical protein